MASRRTSGHSRGFTLLEILVVIGLLAVIGGFSFVVGFDDYRGFSFRNERDVVAATLQKARSQAMSNMCFGDSCTDGKPHGVHFGTAGEYVIFQGDSYASRDSAVDEVVEVENAATTVSGLTEVVFERLSGDASTFPSGTDTLTVTDDRGRTSVFTVEPEGRIWWTN